MELTDHIGRLREWMAEHDFDAFIVESCSNVMWLTMFDGIEDHENPHTIVVTPEVARYYTDGRYLAVSEAGAEGTPWEVVCEARDRYGVVASDFESAKRIAVEGSLPVARYNAYSEKLSGEVIPQSLIIENIRSVKDEQEIELIRTAQSITDRTFAHLCEWMKVGMTEREIALELEFYMRAQGSEGVAFGSIVAAGKNAAFPHAHPSDYAVQTGDMLTLDFGARYKGYCSDMTRTIVFGSPTDEQRRVHDTVRESQLAALGACKAGMSGKELHEIANAVIEAAGFEAIPHGLGHGVGIDIHERPVTNAITKDILPENGVLTIEPGIYIVGFGGVRIEDMVVIKEAGCENLTQSPKDLIEL